MNDFIVDDLYAYTSEEGKKNPAVYSNDTIIALQDLLDDFILSYHPLAYSYGDEQDVNTGRLIFEYDINEVQYNISLVYINNEKFFIISNEDKEWSCSFEQFASEIKNIPVLVPQD